MAVVAEAGAPASGRGASGGLHGAPTVDVLLTSLYNTRYVPVRCDGSKKVV
jgi:hypothetical protein